MAVVEQEGFGDIYRAEDLALLARTRNDYMAFSYYASKTLDSDAIPEGTPVNYYLLHGEKNNPYLKATEWNWQIDPLGFAPSLPATPTTGACRSSRLKTALA